MNEMKCAMCKNDGIPASKTFRWDAELRKCFKEYHGTFLCSGCIQTLNDTSRYRFFKDKTCYSRISAKLF